MSLPCGAVIPLTLSLRLVLGLLGIFMLLVLLAASTKQTLNRCARIRKRFGARVSSQAHPGDDGHAPEQLEQPMRRDSVLIGALEQDMVKQLSAFALLPVLQHEMRLKAEAAIESEAEDDVKRSSTSIRKQRRRRRRRTSTSTETRSRTSDWVTKAITSSATSSEDVPKRESPYFVLDEKG